MNDDVVGHIQAARILGISPASLYNYRSLGLGPPALEERQRGRPGPPRLRYRVADIKAWKAAATCQHCGQYIPMAARSDTREDGSR